MRIALRGPVFLRLWRLALLAAAVLLIHGAAQHHRAGEAVAALAAERVRDFFPEAADLGVAMAGARRPVLDSAGRTLGFVATTAPESDRFIGYSGPTNCLLVYDWQGSLTGLRVLGSHDTADHLAEVVADRKFFAQFRGKSAEELAVMPLHTVSGATLTSTAIAQGVLARLGQGGAVSLRFPEEIALDEVRRLEPTAASLVPSIIHHSGFDVLDGTGARVAVAVRTAPLADTLIGYKGPTDTLMLLDASGEHLRSIALRKSYDTRRYVAYVTGDDYFLGLFKDMSLERLGSLDFAAAGIEGVSGATETSWAVAEGIKRRARGLCEEAAPLWLPRWQWRWQDTGHVAVLLSAVLMAFTSLRGRPLARHIHHALLVVYAGLVSGEMLSQGMLAGWAAHGTPWRNAPGLVSMAAVALLGPVITRRHLYCHHVCPHGALQQLLARRLAWQWQVRASLGRWLERLPFALLGWVFLVAVAGWAVDLNALEPFDAWLFYVAGWPSITIAITGLLASVFMPLAYCRYGCPTGALFKLLRFTGDGDHLGARDWLAAVLIGAGILWL